MFLQLLGPHESVLALILAAVMALALGRGVIDAAGDQRSSYFYMAVFAAFGVVTTTALHYGRIAEIAWGPYVAVTALLGWYAFASVARGFIGWCCSVPDRDVLVRREWRAAWGHWGEGKEPAAGTGKRVALLYSQLMAFIGVLFFLGAPMQLWRLDVEAALLVPVGAFLVGSLVALLSGTATPWQLLRVSSRAAVLWLTYATGRTADDGANAIGTYQMAGAFRDHRLRRLLIGALVICTSMTAVALVQWPTPLGTLDPAEVRAPGFLRDLFCYTVLNQPPPKTPAVGLEESLAAGLLPFAARAAGMTAVPLLYLFVTFAGTLGPGLAVYYREFAENAVRIAERSSGSGR